MILVIVKSSLVIIFAAVAAQALHRQSAAVRHLIWTAGLLAALAVPICSSMLPSWQPELAAKTADLFQSQSTPLETPVAIKSAPASAALPAATSVLPMEQLALWIWLAGVAVGLVLLLAGALRLRWIAAHARRVTNGRSAAVVREIGRDLKLKRPIRLLESEHVSMLGTWGILRPRVLMPHEGESWSAGRLRVVIGHELAHIQRHDWLVQMIAEAARAFYWFNPLFWFACSRLRRESEHACDDTVLNLGIDGQTYAAHLLELARTLNNSNRAWCTVLAMAQAPNLERRFVAMLNPSMNRRAATRGIRLIATLVVIGVTLPLAAMRAPAQRPTPQVAAVIAPASPAKILPAPAPVSPRTPRPARTAPAQTATGALSGTISDPSGAVLPRVTVRVSNAAERVEQSTISGDAGTFAFPQLPAGQYVFQAELPGFMTFRSGVLIQPNQRAEQTVTMRIGSISERLTVVAAGTPRPVQEPAPGIPRRIRVGGVVQAANLIYQARPVYPQAAQDAGVEGTVALQGVIGTDGKILTVWLLSKTGKPFASEFVDAANAAINQWRYRPTLLNGEPVEVLTDITIDFRLAQ